MTIEIDRVANISVDEFRRKYSKRRLPVIISGCVEHWPAKTKWSLDYFANRFPAKKLYFGGRHWVLSDFIAHLRSGAKPLSYLKEVKLDEQFPELNADIGDLKLTRDNLLNSVLLPRSMRIRKGIKAVFIGSAGSGFGTLHWDYTYTHVFIAQVRGDKDFVLFAPEDSPYLYPNPEYPNKSTIDDFNEFDLKAYPNVQNASPIRFTIYEGETLFIPAGWWHATQMHGISISIAESTLDKSNWRQRADWYLEEFRKSNVSAVKLAILRIYMRTIELVLP